MGRRFNHAGQKMVNVYSIKANLRILIQFTNFSPFQCSLLLLTFCFMCSICTIVGVKYVNNPVVASGGVSLINLPLLQHNSVIQNPAKPWGLVMLGIRGNLTSSGEIPIIWKTFSLVVSTGRLQTWDELCFPWSLFYWFDYDATVCS